MNCKVSTLTTAVLGLTVDVIVDLNLEFNVDLNVELNEDLTVGRSHRGIMDPTTGSVIST